MALLDIFKKKTKKQMELPPPPMPGPQTDLAHPSETHELPELPPLPDEEPQIPPITATPPPTPEEHEAAKQAIPPPPKPMEEIPMPKELAKPEPHDITPHVEPTMPEHLPPPMHKVTHKELEEIEEPEVSWGHPKRDVTKPVFVNVADYQDIMNGIDKIRHTLSDSEDIISKLNDLKNAEDKVFEDWRTQIEDIERKLTYIDQVIFRGE